MRQDDSRPNLLTLPTELLFQITDYLDSGDTSSLLLCSHALLNKHGAASLKSFRISDESNEERQRFLLGLSRDNPSYFLCYTCSHLHPLARIVPPGLGFKSTHLQCLTASSCWEQPTCSRSDASYPTYWFYFHHLQLAMLRHRYGPSYGLALEALSSTAVQISSSKATTLSSREASVICDAHCLRVQELTLLPHHEDPSTDYTKALKFICGHIHFLIHSSAQDLVACKTQHFDQEAGCPTCCSLLRCCRCGIEFQVDIEALGDGRIVLVITKWLNLGHGETPLDLDWQRHLDSIVRYLILLF